MNPYYRCSYGYALVGPDRFKAKIERTETCWLWTGAIQSRGYGSFGIDGTTYLAHRVAYWLWRGDIDDGLTINHLCGVKRCVNPQHLEAGMTPQQAADYLGVSIRTLYRWEDDGLVSPRRTPGGHRRYSRDDIDALLGRSA